MKHFTRTTYFLFFVFIICSMSLTSCKTMRTSEKAVSESETASVTASRLTFYRTLDSLSRQFSMSADSIIMIFASSPEFPSELPSGMEGRLETPSDSQSIPQTQQARQRIRNASRSASASRPSQILPQSLKIYGLHIADNSEEKSIAYADLKDSVALVTQSQKLKSAKKLSSKPNSAPYYILTIVFIILVIYTVYRLRRLI